MLCLKNRHVQNLFAGRSFLRINLKQRLQYGTQVIRVMAWNFRIDSFHNSVVESLHVFSCERRIQGNQLVKDTAEWPDIRFVIIRFVLPDLRTCIVGCSCLCLENASLGYFRHIQISKLDHPIFCEEDVGTLDISVDDLLGMQSL